VIAIVLLVAVAAVLVRLGKPHRPPGWTRSQAPALFAVVDQIAAAVGAPPPARILATHELNTRVMGHRPRAVLAIGLPGWAAMPPAGRVALVAHALAAGSDGGVGRSPVVTAALASLQEWRYLLQPNPQAARRRPRRRRAGGRSASNLGIADLVLPVVLAPIYLLTVTLEWLLSASTLAATQRAGYRAVLRAGEIAGPDGGRALLRPRIMRARIDSEWEVALRRAPDSDLVNLPRDYLASLDDAVVDAVCARDRTAALAPVDDGPPPVLLADVVATTAGALSPAAVTVDPTQLAAADAELERARPELRRDLRADLEEQRARLAIQANDYPR